MAKLVPLMFIFFFASLPAGAVGKISIDPNHSKAAISSKFDLSQKITYSAGKKCTSVILQDLSKLSGIQFYSGYNNNDWQIRDRRMNIFVKDMPLTELMDSIARVSKCKWSENEISGKVSYRLILDKQAFDEATSHRLAVVEQARKKFIDGRQRLLNALDAAVKMSETDLQELKEQSPYVYLISTNWNNFHSKIFADKPTAKAAWLTGKRFVLDSSSIPDDPVLAFFSNSKKPDGVVFSINGFCDSLTEYTGIIGHSLLASQNEDGSMNSLMMALFDPTSEQAKYFGKIMYAETQNETQLLDQEFQKAMKNERMDTGESLNTHSDDAVLHTKIKLKIQGDLISDLFSAFAESSDLNVVADCWDRKHYGRFKSNEIEIQALLDILEKDYRYNWQKHNSTLEIHSRDWLQKLNELIPESKLEVWRSSYKTNGTLSLDELAQISLFSYRQIEANMRNDEVLGNGNVCDAVHPSDEILRLYANLNTEQKALIFTEHGLSTKQGFDISILAANDSEGVCDPSNFKQFLFACLPNDEYRLIGKKKDNGKQVNYEFNVINSSGKSVASPFIVKCPIYTPPKEEVKSPPQAEVK